MNYQARRDKLWDAISDNDVAKIVHYSKEIIKKGIPHWDKQTGIVAEGMLKLYE